jgi:hypothetical protein
MPAIEFISLAVALGALRPKSLPDAVLHAVTNET